MPMLSTLTDDEIMVPVTLSGLLFETYCFRSFLLQLLTALETTRGSTRASYCRLMANVCIGYSKQRTTGILGLSIQPITCIAKKGRRERFIKAFTNLGNPGYDNGADVSFHPISIRFAAFMTSHTGVGSKMIDHASFGIDVGIVETNSNETRSGS